MATDLELTLSADYVQDWTVEKAISELFQNSIDQMAVDPLNTMICSHDGENGILRIGNKTSSLSRSSLLMGVSSKRGDENTIGQFGEGYKLALLVLTRLNHKVNIFNYGTKELWVPRLKESRKYKTKVLAISITKHIFTSVPHNNLVFEIHGIDSEYYEVIKSGILQLQEMDESKILQTTSGRVLLDDKYEGKVFVNGLFVCKSKCSMGYDFKPSKITLDRDRRLVGDFNLAWQTSNMWAELAPKVDYNEVILPMIEAKYLDVEYLDKHCYAPVLPKRTHDDFRSRHGERAIPVTTQAEINSARMIGLEPVLTTEVYQRLVTASPDYKIHESVAATRSEPFAYMEEMANEIDHELSSDSLNKLMAVVQLSREWTWE